MILEILNAMDRPIVHWVSNIETRGFSTWEPTFCAVWGFFSTVNEEVLIQISCLAQRAATVKCLLTSLGVAMFGKLCPRVSFQVSSDTACQKKFIVSLVTFERFFSRVNYQMSSQIACQNRCIVTLVAFELLFSSVSFQTFSQIIWVNSCEVALVA